MPAQIAPSESGRAARRAQPRRVVAVTSTFPWDSYVADDGTSQGAPLVSGAIALYASRYPAANPTRIHRALLQSTQDTPSLRNKTRTGGCLDVGEMLKNDHDVWGA